ncbi:hypothetical protein SAMN04488598_1119 [Halanaerobium congolense]|uniref:Uncharacterized protein n=1 Tax=Halanaerobium congolense TaxID=54121 RepID=A0A1I0AA87_9FIRM|nr:hypothetical protein C7953_0572 [Halanaerobium congolense]TDP17958.1 hypothetical protein C8C79_1137 [Halanaerobium congolense]SDF38201.1 hypothetical protein SAMN04488598_1119 [Halanaerobium congolense]SES91056.1 hypothetical protein SAMN04515652_11110 [Halanaerobium congolense]SFP21804.1 hypothetical protein SAMN04488596_10910 [Halanaerobium congolense]
MVMDNYKVGEFYTAKSYKESGFNFPRRSYIQ